jgi:hypothetical protein
MKKIRIRDKHPGFAILVLRLLYGPDPLVSGTDPRIRIQICTKMSRIHNTVNIHIPGVAEPALVLPLRSDPEEVFSSL